MAADDRARLEELFHGVVELSPAGREEFIASLTGADAELVPELEALLDGHEPDGPLDRLSEEVAAAPLGPVNPSELTGTSVDQYEIGELIGRGGMGDVYRARDTRLGRDVALKFLPAWLGRNPAARDRFLVEARSVSSIDHTNVCTLHDLGESDDGRLFLIMPYYEGASLKERLAEGPLPVDEAVNVALQTARGLAAAHARDVVHRDVKPGNLLLTDDGRVKILDFGVAKLADVDLTRTGQTPGTASYMSPEQRAGGEVDVRSDLWSLGAVLYEMLSGKRPGGEAAVRSELASAPPALAAIVEGLLAESPEERYPDARSLAEDLAVLAEGGEALSARPAPSATRFLAELKRRNVFRVAAVYGVIGFGVIEVADAVFPRIPLPEWTVSLVVWLVLLGLPVALVLAWAFETSPGGGVRRTRSLQPAILDAIAAQPARRRWPIALAGVVGGVLLAVGAWLSVDRTAIESSLAGLPFGGAVIGRPLPPDGTDERPVTVAVIAASSSEEDDMGEGLAGLLARGLDDVVGVRSAPENLVLRGWRARDAATADSAAAIDVARSVGAHAAILLTSTTIGGPLRVDADVYPVPPTQIGESSFRVQGEPTELIALIDGLAVKLVAGLLPAETRPRASIAAISTASLPAMQVFLLGEQARRRNELPTAIAHFRRAVEEDSTFALAWYRLQTTYGWTGALDLATEAGEHARRHADRLPARERLIVNGYSLSVHGGGLAEVEDAVRVNPGDWELLELLSEMYLHTSWRAGVSPRRADSMRALAASLAPENPDLLHHELDLALGFWRDSLAADRTIAEFASRNAEAAEYRLSRDLVFGTGNTERQDSLLAALPDATFSGLPYRFAHPLSTAGRERVNAELANREQTLWKKLEPRYFTHLARGRLGDALRSLAVPDMTPLAREYSPRSKACHAYMLLATGIDLEGTDAGQWLSPPPADSLSATASPQAIEEMLCFGGRAVDRHDWDGAAAWLSRLRQAAAATEVSTAEPTIRALAESLDLYLRWARGESGLVIPRATRLEVVDGGASWPIRWWTARMFAEAGREEEALEVYESFWFPAWVPAFLRRAELSEELGRTDEARELYTVVLTVWADADPAFAPLLERARAGLARLDGGATASAPPVADVS